MPLTPFPCIASMTYGGTDTERYVYSHGGSSIGSVARLKEKDPSHLAHSYRFVCPTWRTHASDPPSSPELVSIPEPPEVCVCYHLFGRLPL